MRLYSGTMWHVESSLIVTTQEQEAENACDNCHGVGVVYEMHGQEHPLRMLELIRVTK